MKQDLGVSISRNTAGVEKGYVLMYPAATFVSTATLTALLIRYPVTYDSFFLILPYCNTACMNIFLEHLSAAYPDDYIVLVCDGAAWHKSGTLKLPANIELMFIPPYTPEMNPIEQIWKELRARGFHNEAFQTLDKVVDRLCGTICSLTPETIRSITARDWIVGCFN